MTMLAQAMRRAPRPRQLWVAAGNRRLTEERAVRILTAAVWEPQQQQRSITSTTLSSTNRSQVGALQRLFPSTTKRWFQSESDFHTVADDTLDAIQDAIDDALDTTDLDYEVTLASGVLTLTLPGKGTWVINKQTPNQQLWWSSPLSGPKRFEYDDSDHIWFSTKDGLSLGPFLKQELRHVYPSIQDFELEV